MRRTPFAIALFAGLLTGIVDGAVMLFNLDGVRTLAGGFSLADFFEVIWLWMTLCCAAAIVFAWRRLGRLRVIPIVFAGPGLFLLGRVTFRVREWTSWSPAIVLLAWLGVTLLLCAMTMRIRLEESKRRARWAIVTAVSLALVLLRAADLNFADFAAKPAPVTNDARRNVVLLILDAGRWDDTMNTKHIGAFARGAVSFDNAWSSAPWTVPSHFAMFTGRDPWSVSYDPNAVRYQYDGTWIAGWFRSRGYATSGIFANNRLSAEAGYGRDFEELMVSRQTGVCRSAIGYLLGYSNQRTGVHPPLCDRIDAKKIVRRARSFVHRAKRPYFLAMNFTDTHYPYTVARECRAPGLELVPHAPRRTVVNATPRHPPTPEALRLVRAQYRAALACADREIAALLRDIDDGNTVIAITADHGESFNEHGLGGHGNTLFREVLHVPLIVKIPGMAPARVSDEVSTTDLYMTLVRAGERNPSPLPLFTPALRRPAMAAFDIGSRSGFSVARGGRQFIRFSDGRELLYDFAADPDTQHPLPVTSDAAPLREMVLRASRHAQRPVEFHSLGYLR